MKYLLRGIFLTTILLSSFSGLAQAKSSPTAVELVKYNDNVNLPLSVKERGFLQEVYGDELQELILSKPQRLKDVKDILRNRVEIVLASQHEKSEYAPLLSSVPLFDNYNDQLEPDITFSKNGFNPLKYRFHFHGFGTSMYRIDKTNYVLIIKPQHRKGNH